MTGKKLGTVSLEGSIWHYMDAKTVAAYGPWVRQVDAAAQVAAAYERAFRAAFRACKSIDAGYIDENSRIAQRIENELRLEVSKAIKNLATSDQTDALEAVKREARNEALMEAVGICRGLQERSDKINEQLSEQKLPGVCIDPDADDCANAIEALIEKGPDHGETD